MGKVRIEVKMKRQREKKDEKAKTNIMLNDRWCVSRLDI